MMLNAEYTKKLLNVDSFIRAQHELMNAFKLTDYESQQVLYSYVVEKRLKNWDIKDVYDALDCKDDMLTNKLKWLITYSRRSITAENNKEYKRQQLNDSLETHLDIIQLDSIDRISEENLDRILALIPSLFADSSTARWVQSVLEHGKDETQETFNQTPKAFRDKLRNVEKYCDNHREKFINIVVSKEQREYITEENVLKEFIDVLANINSDDEDIQELINQNEIYIDDLIGQIPMIKKPLVLINNFKNANQQDKYKLINMINERYEYLKSKLIEE